MYTEEEALKQLCPLVTPLRNGTCNCRGDDCMMWRFGPPYCTTLDEITLKPGEKPDDYNPKDALLSGTYPSIPCWKSETTVTSGVTRWKKTQWLRDKGFCGLAGSPR